MSEEMVGKSWAAFNAEYQSIWRHYQRDSGMPEAVALMAYASALETLCLNFLERNSALDSSIEGGLVSHPELKESLGWGPR